MFGPVNWQRRVCPGWATRFAHLDALKEADDFKRVGRLLRAVLCSEHVLGGAVNVCRIRNLCYRVRALKEGKGLLPTFYDGMIYDRGAFSRKATQICIFDAEFFYFTAPLPGNLIRHNFRHPFQATTEHCDK